MKVVLASGNQGKLRELGALLKDVGMDLVAQSEFDIASPPETGLTFVENALIKARHAAAESGLPALADDSGIAVDALQGAPGIYSARYAGEDASDADNVNKLLEAMRDFAQEGRGAAFHCVLVYLRHAKDPTPLIAHGKWQGRILEAVQGEGGFGYDPVFWCPEFETSAAMLSREDKNRISHRGKALALLLEQLRATQA